MGCAPSFSLTTRPASDFDHEGVEQGPVCTGNLKAWQKMGYLSADSLARHEGGEEVRRLGEDFPASWHAGVGV